MQVNRCIRELVDATPGASMRGVSVALGKADTYVRNVAAPTRSPALATVADVADVLGYDLVLVRRSDGTAMGTIEPPRKAAGDPVEG